MIAQLKIPQGKDALTKRIHAPERLRTRLCVGLQAGILSVLLCVALQVSTVAAQPLSATSHHQGPTDPRELEAFLDPFFAEQMERLHVPGAVFLVVKDGEIFFSKGYGFADLEKKTPVVPDQTLFRVSSISKLFTATAVMQLSERGLLNLDEDVNKYLTLFHLENNYPHPVTVAHLLTHTGGFDDRGIGAGARSAVEVVPLGQHLAARMPPRVLPPGEVISYSNYGAALAGYVVEVVSGVPFAQYIDENILQPLGMQHSSFLSPPHLMPDLAVGYEYANNTYQPARLYYHHIAPAGSLITTATDIARFMMAHLQNGRYGQARILTEATAQDMHRQHFTHHPRLPGMAYGFFERMRNNQRMLWHGGTSNGYYSLLFLLPEQNLGFFFACNTLQDSLWLLQDELIRRFFDHYYPVQAKAPPQPSAEFQQHASHFTGSYLINVYARRTIGRLGSARLPAEFRVTAGDGGSLLLHYPGGLYTTHWAEVEPLLFQQVDGTGSLAFREDTQGRITHMFFAGATTDEMPWALDRLLWYETAAFQLSLGGVLVLVFLSTCLVWPTGALMRRWRNRLSSASKHARLARLLAILASTLNLVFLLGLSLALVRLGPELVYGVPPVVTALLCLPLVTTLLTVALPMYTVLAWKNHYWSLTGRLYYSLITLAALAYIPLLLYWNLLGFRF